MGSSKSDNSFDAIKSFAERLGQGQLAPQILADIEYHTALVEGGDLLERSFAIFSNVLELGSDGHVVNTPQAQQRAAQAIRQ